MKVSITTAAPSEQGLTLGLAVIGPKEAWLKFAVCELIVPSLDRECRRALVQALSIGLPESIGADEPLPGLSPDEL